MKIFSITIGYSHDYYITTMRYKIQWISWIDFTYYYSFEHLTWYSVYNINNMYKNMFLQLYFLFKNS